jgi:hypothetical protein
MRPTKHQLRLLALCKVKGVSWHLIAREAQRPDGVDRLGREPRSSPRRMRPQPRGSYWSTCPADQQATLHAAVQQEIDKVQHKDVRLVTVIDNGYPPTLRLIYNLPPFLSSAVPSPTLTCAAWPLSAPAPPASTASAGQGRWPDYSRKKTSRRVRPSPRHRYHRTHGGPVAVSRRAPSHCISVGWQSFRTPGRTIQTGHSAACSVASWRASRTDQVGRSINATVPTRGRCCTWRSRGNNAGCTTPGMS